MTITIGWAALAVIVAILGHAGASIWWAAKMTSEMSNIHVCLDKIDAELAKRDHKMDAAFIKIDGHEHRITVMEANLTKGGTYKKSSQPILNISRSPSL